MIIIIRRVTRRFDEIALHSFIRRVLICRAHQSLFHWFVVIFSLHTVFVKSHRFAVLTIFATQRSKKKTHPTTKQVNSQSKRAQHRFIFIENRSFLRYNFQTVHGNNVGFRACHSVGWVALSYSATAYSCACACLCWYVCLRIFVLSNGHDFGL